MAIIYTYPSGAVKADDLIVVSEQDSGGIPTKNITVSALAAFLNGSISGGVGTTNYLVKFTDGATGLVGDSIMNEDVDKIYLDGELRIGSSSGTRNLQIFHGPLDSNTDFSTGGATGTQIIGRDNELYIENRGASRGDIIFKANNGEDDGSADTYFLLDASMADIGDSSRYTRWPDNSRIVLGNSSNTTSLDFEMYHDGATGLKNGSSNLSIESKGGISIQNEDAGEIEIYNDRNSDLTLRSEGDIKLLGSGLNQYFRVDSGLGYSVASKDIQFRDNVKAKFGNGDDLLIYHDGANSIIEDVGVGDLNISGALSVNILGGGVQTAAFSPAGFVATFGGTNKIATSATGINLSQDGDGITLKSPNGTSYIITVDNAGNLVVT